MASKFSAQRRLTPGEAAQLAHDVLLRAQRALHRDNVAAPTTVWRKARPFGPWLEFGAIAVCGMIAAVGWLAQG